MTSAHTHFRKLVAKFLINLVLIENETNCIMCLVFIHMLKRRFICVWVVCVCECAAIVIIYFMIYISKTLSFNFLFSSRINLISVYICICIIYYSWHIFQKMVFIVWRSCTHNHSIITKIIPMTAKMRFNIILRTIKKKVI